MILLIKNFFKNARQKARKIYENQPNQDNERFIRTPGCNFQCQRCNLVFQRYYELIQHQQKFCYADDRAAQQNDNKSLEDHLDDEERAQHQAQQHKSNETVKLDDDSNMDGQSSADNNNTTHNFFKLLNDVKSSNGDILMKMVKNFYGLKIFKTLILVQKPAVKKQAQIC